MLVLTRRKNERIRIGESIVVTVVEVRGDKVRIGIDAPQDIPVHREEVYQAIAARTQLELAVRGWPERPDRAV